MWRMDGNDYFVHDFESFWKIPEERNVAEYIVSKCEQHAAAGKTECVKNGLTGETLNYGDFDKISSNIASTFVKLGLNEGDTVIYSTHDPAKVHVFMVGIWRANGIVRSSYPEDIGDVLVKRIEESHATFVACDEPIAEAYLEAASAISWDVKVIVFGEANGCISIQEFWNDDGNELREITRFGNDIALVLGTSGTTGNSKGAMCTHKTLLEYLVAYEQMPFTDRDDEPTIITSRQTHFVGSVAGLSFITKGRLLLTFAALSVPVLLEGVSTHKVRAIVGFPKYLTSLVNHPTAGNYDMSSLHFLASAGQVMVPESLALVKQLPNLQAFINLYGMTEAGLLVTSADWNAMKEGHCGSLAEKDYSIGKLPPQTSLKVLDIDTGEILGPNSTGELCFQTNLKCSGYLNRPEEDLQTFQDGWVKTGDIGYYDEEGFVFVVDRAKEIFKYYNNHISPTEIENMLLRHPGIGEAVVIGVTDPDGGGSVPRAFVVLKPNKHYSEAELMFFAENNLAPYMHLRGGLHILSQIPVGKTGKVTRKLFENMELPLPAFPTKSSEIYSPSDIVLRNLGTIKPNITLE